MAGGGAVRLGEGREEFGYLPRRYPDAGVLDREFESDLVGRGGLLIAACRSPLVLFHLDEYLSLGGEFHRIADQIDEHLAEAQGIADQAARHVFGEGDDHLNPLSGDPVGEHVGEVFRELMQAEAHRLKVQLAGLDLGIIEDVVDDPEQDPGRCSDLVEIVMLLGGQIGSQRQIRESHDGVHRGPDLMAHVRQELALGMGRGLGLLLGGLKLRGALLHQLFQFVLVGDQHPLGLLHLRDVPDDADQRILTGGRMLKQRPFG